MEIDVTIDDMYFQGNGQPESRAVVVIMQNKEDKKMIFRNIAAISSCKNKQGNKLIFQDFYTPQSNDQRVRNQHIFDMYAADPSTQKLISVTNKGLKVGSQLYKKKITAPSYEDIMDLNETDFRKVLSTPTSCGTKIFTDRSWFTRYTICAQTHQ